MKVVVYAPKYTYIPLRTKTHTSASDLKFIRIFTSIFYPHHIYTQQCDYEAFDYLIILSPSLISF